MSLPLAKNDGYKGPLIQWGEETSQLLCISLSGDIPRDKLHIPSSMEKLLSSILNTSLKY